MGKPSTVMRKPICGGQLQSDEEASEGFSKAVWAQSSEEASVRFSEEVSVRFPVLEEEVRRNVGPA